MSETPLRWVGSSRDDVRAFPADARRRAGFELHQVQRGLPPSDWKSMTAVGSGVMELRIRTGIEHRVFFVTRFEEAVYVLHAFEKKSRRTSKRDLDLARPPAVAAGAARRRTQSAGVKAMSEQITPSTGNVFEDVGFSREEAENLKVRSALMGKLRSIIEEEGLTQARAAEIFGVTQPRVSDLVRGKIELFSIDALVNMLGSAGRTVDVTVRSATDEAA